MSKERKDINENMGDKECIVLSLCWLFSGILHFALGKEILFYVCIVISTIYNISYFIISKLHDIEQKLKVEE